jgi:predicted Zn-dependent protease
MRLYLEIDAACLVHNGTVKGRSGPIIAAARPEDFLGGLIAVGDDFEVDLDRGYCLKDGAAVAVTVGQPSVLFEGLEITRAKTR